MGCCGSKESNEEKSPIRNDFKPQYGQTTQVQEPAVNNHPTIHISSHYDDEDDGNCFIHLSIITFKKKLNKIS